MTKLQKLEYLWSAIKRAYPKSDLVFNDGSPDSKVMIIGEAPGRDEVVQGKPFVGRAGKLLNSTLGLLGWQRSDFYISNVVKFRPTDSLGGNRTPTPEEIEKFKPALEKEVEIVNPRAMVLLGKVAMAGFGVQGSMSENRGRTLDCLGHKTIITFHPAAILRNINWEPNFREDLSKIKKLLE